MWFTQVSLRNPVFATMLMLALMVLGLFSFQRLKVDQFPNIDFPVVVVTTEYPGASPEIVESEVSKKVEEVGQRHRGCERTDLAQLRRPVGRHHRIPAAHRRAQGGRRRAREDRHCCARASCTEVKEPKVLRFDPAARAIWSVAVLPDASSAPTLPAARGSLPPEGAAPALGRPGGGAPPPRSPLRVVRCPPRGLPPPWGGPAAGSRPPPKSRVRLN